MYLYKYIHESIYVERKITSAHVKYVERKSIIYAFLIHDNYGRSVDTYQIEILSAVPENERSERSYNLKIGTGGALNNRAERSANTPVQSLFVMADFPLMTP